MTPTDIMGSRAIHRFYDGPTNDAIVDTIHGMAKIIHRLGGDVFILPANISGDEKGVILVSQTTLRNTDIVSELSHEDKVDVDVLLKAFELNKRVVKRIEIMNALRYEKERCPRTTFEK